MVFNVLCFIAAYELVFYGYMVASREWIFSPYRRTVAEDDGYADAMAAFDYGGGDDDEEPYDFGSFIVND